MLILQVEQTPLIGAAWKGRLEVVKFLCEKGSNIEARDTVRLYVLCLVNSNLNEIECLPNPGY